MSFISYAQNYEDVMLWRALKHVKEGFYIDVGAWSPIDDSVTNAFYERGWSGVNIEPNVEFIKLYEDIRSRDINLCIALSDYVGEEEMHFVSNPGLSSLNREIAESHATIGFESSSSTVTVESLEKVCKDYVGEREIHFLKVDVEGLEENVLKGNDWRIYRPWIVVVEATLPMSQIETYEDWEPVLLNADYVFVYADGLNRYYVSAEHLHLQEAFKYPPNVFDDFKSSVLVKLEHYAQEVESRADESEHRLSALEDELDAIYKSYLWKIYDLFRRLKRSVFKLTLG